MHVPALSTEGGMALAVGDVCREPSAGLDAAAEPPEPMLSPYANVAATAGCERTSRRVLVRNRATVVIDSERALTAPPDGEPREGAVSHTVGGKATFRAGSSKVYAEMKRIVALSHATSHNGSSANMPAGTVVVPSQTKVLVAR